MISLLKRRNFFQVPSKIVNPRNGSFQFKTTTYSPKRYFFRPDEEFKFWEERFSGFGEQIEKYTPSNPINFRNGWADLYFYDKYNLARYFFLAFVGIFGYLGYKSFKKIVNYQDRSVLGFIFYFLLGLYSVRACRIAIRQQSMIIEKIRLKEDGRTVGIKTYQFGLIPKVEYADIATIIRPPNIFQSLTHQLGFTFYVDTKTYLLPRGGKILNREILPVVLNGVYINVSPDEIII